MRNGDDLRRATTMRRRAVDLVLDCVVADHAKRLDSRSAALVGAAQALVHVVFRASRCYPAGFLSLRPETVARLLGDTGFTRPSRVRRVERAESATGVDRLGLVALVLEALRPHAWSLGLIEPPDLPA